MIRHFVWFTLKDNFENKSAAENAYFLLNASAELHGNPNIKSLEVVAKVDPASTVPAQLVITALFEDEKAFEAYKVDPVHLRFGKLVQERMETRNCIDYTFLPYEVK